MLVHSFNFPKCGISRASSFSRKEVSFPVISSRSFFFQPAHVDKLKLNRNKNINCRTKGLGYQTTFYQTMEITQSAMAVSDHLQELPLSTSYENAMEALSSLITRQKRTDRSAVSKQYDKLGRMLMYLKIMELEDCLANLKIIHVAGTKGKGSTCAFCEAILRECGFRTGLFTSPHLIDVRERFRIDGMEISEDKFLFYFWDCWNKLKEHVTEELPMPPLFQFLTILAFTIFAHEKVDVSIIEVGLGGLTDSTNVIKDPVVCGIASLGMDHTETLGNTLGEIAAHKAGIFKPQVPAFTVPQLPEAMNVIKEKAHKLMVPLEVAVPLDYEKLRGTELSLSGDHQLTNAGLAVSLCNCWLQRTGNWNNLHEHNRDGSLPDAFVRGLSSARMSGRAQVVYDSTKSDISSEKDKSSSGDLIFYLDGAHSPESMEVCAKWFSSAVEGKTKSSSSDVVKLKRASGNGTHGYIQSERRNLEEGDNVNKISKKILLFNCMEVRDPHVLLPQIFTTCASSGTYFSKAIFVPSMSTHNKVTSGSSAIPSDIPSKDLSWQYRLQRIWESIVHGTETDASPDRITRSTGAEGIPPREFLYEESSHCNPADGHMGCSAVIPSLPLTIKWLRDSVRENPSLRVQVLVTGSLHLIGDVLKLLKR